MTENNSKPIISKIYVDGLFGQYEYTLGKDSDLPNPSIVYGDNGVGKTTILRTVFHILSPSDDRGHRQAIRKTPFSKFIIYLSSGVKFVATKPDGADGETVVLEILNEKEPIAEWVFTGERSTPEFDIDIEILDFYDRHPERILSLREDHQKIIRTAKRRQKSKVIRGKPGYLHALREHAPIVYLVNADRQIESDSLPKSTDAIEFRHILTERGATISDVLMRTRDVALTQALDSASRWIQLRAVSGTNQGSTNVHSVYENVVSQISNDYREEDTDHLGHPEHNLESIYSDLLYIEHRSRELTEYGLAAPLNMESFRQALERSSGGSRDIVTRLIDPYLKSLKGRLRAYDSIYEILDLLIRTINSYLHDKNIKFNMVGGFSIISDKKTELKSSDLSSGEKQLLLMLCYALTARDHPSIFMIDEPEISLNVKWQRNIVDSLLALSGNTNSQFILASHSVELIAQHRNRVVRFVKN